ncbi:related to integral membrane protein [Cephalotrichum gorgonifer]|uniref:Related to integral membrane protein n=1 Tax=Cephalotrichum gorgonifer TaxID=2041049 RepID=A0AAE8SYY0_9PEZI|nr:related to integral membrane protein [Cephalotrichum gorgonifer]
MSVLLLISAAFATIFVAFGVNAILQPSNTLTFFELSAPTAPADRQIVDALLAVYGVRDIFMGAAIYAAAYFGSRKALGWIVISGSAVAFADGAVCQVYAGNGAWNHWGYAPVLTVVGGLLALGY